VSCFSLIAGHERVFLLVFFFNTLSVLCMACATCDAWSTGASKVWTVKRLRIMSIDPQDSQLYTDYDILQFI
jgi:hypothetical protein